MWPTPMTFLLSMGGLLALTTELLGKDISNSEEDFAGYVFYAVALSYIGVGGLILNRLARHRLAWVLVAFGFSLLLAGLAATLGEDHGLVAAGAAGGTLWFTWPLLAGFFFLWFPTGSPPSRRWKWLESFGYVGGIIAISYTFSRRLCVESDINGNCIDWTDNPWGISWLPNPEFEIGEVSLGVIAVFVIGSAASLVVRFMRSNDTERKQLQWLIYAVVLMIGWILVSEWIPAAALPVQLADAIFALALIGLPAATAIAVLRYRLYDIDRLISRTVTYAFVVGVLAGALVVAAALVGSQVAEQPLFVAAATLSVAAIFNPLRKRIQLMVDRRFNRTRYDAERVMDSFSWSLRDGVDLDDVVDGWVGVVSETMQPSSLRVWVRE